MSDTASYCKAERLIWEYDSTTAILRLLHSRLILNCAAELSAEAVFNERGITVVEKDNRDPNVGALCVCPFDTYLEIPDVKSESIAVNCSKKTSVLNLIEGKGSIVLDSADFGFCRN